MQTHHAGASLSAGPPRQMNEMMAMTLAVKALTLGLDMKHAGRQKWERPETEIFKYRCVRDYMVWMQIASLRIEVGMSLYESI